MIHDLDIGAHELLSGSGKAVKSSCLDKVLHRLFVHILLRHPGDKILQINVWASFPSFLYHRIDHRSSYAFNGGQRIADRSAVYREPAFSLIDIRRENGNSHAFAHHNIFCHFFRIINHGGHKRRHKFHRVIIF